MARGLFLRDATIVGVEDYVGDDGLGGCGHGGPLVLVVVLGGAAGRRGAAAAACD